MMFGLGLACSLALAITHEPEALAGDMKLKLVAVPIISGTIDIHENGQSQFLSSIKEFSSAHGFELTVMQLPLGVQCYSFNMLRDDVIVSGESDFDSQKGNFRPLYYQFDVSRNYFKPETPEPDARLRPIAEGLAIDLRRTLKTIASVTIQLPGR